MAVQTQQPAEVRRGNSNATAALALAIAGFFMPLAFIVALVLGTLELRQASREGRPRSGRALAAVVISGLMLAAVLFSILALIVIANTSG